MAVITNSIYQHFTDALFSELCHKLSAAFACLLFGWCGIIDFDCPLLASSQPRTSHGMQPAISGVVGFIGIIHLISLVEFSRRRVHPYWRSAKMIPALISATVALLVFALGNWLTWRKEHTRFLATKLEELYLLLDDLDRLVDFPPSDADDYVDRCTARSREVFRELSRIEMLIALYFPAAEGRFKPLYKSAASFGEFLLGDLDEKIDDAKMEAVSLPVWNGIKDLTSFLSTEAAFLTGRLGQ